MELELNRPQNGTAVLKRVNPDEQPHGQGLHREKHFTQAPGLQWLRGRITHIGFCQKLPSYPYISRERVFSEASRSRSERYVCTTPPPTTDFD